MTAEPGAPADEVVEAAPADEPLDEEVVERETVEEPAEETDNSHLFEDNSVEAPKPAISGPALTVGNYRVTVTAVDLDATDDVMATNEFNSDTNGQYAVVDMHVQYVGTDEGTPFWDHIATIHGADNVQYDDTQLQRGHRQRRLGLHPPQPEGRGRRRLSHRPSRRLPHSEDSVSYDEALVEWVID